MKGLCAVFLMSLSWGTAVSQFNTNYLPASIQDTIPASTLAAIKAKLAADKTHINEPSKEVNNYLRELYDKRAGIVIGEFNDDSFIVEDELTIYLQTVLEGIYSANPTLPRETKVYAYRSEAVNAMSYGEGTIAFTLGLLARMENEAQIAFVLCHELAHYHAQHSDLKMAELARLNFDPQIKKKVKAIEKNSYGQYTKLTKLMGSLGMSITKHSRDKELEADSIALRIYTNTTYDLQAPIRTLEILDSADISQYRSTLELKKYFAFNAYPFKEHWIAYTPSTAWYTSKDDSLHTHPSCAKRIVAIKRQLLRVPAAARKPVKFGSERCDTLRIRSEFEIATSLYHLMGYGRSLFLFLTLVDRYPDNVYVHSMIAQGLYQLYWNQKNHELGKVLAMPDSRFEENYDRYLSFVHKLRLMELASLSYYYTTSKKEAYGTQEDFLYACWLTSKTEVSQEDPAKIKAEYLSRFPSGKYISSMK